MGKLILVRHGETAKNVEGNLHGANDPESLNELGTIQIRKTAKALKKFSPSEIYSSKEKRAIESAKLLSEELHTAVTPIDGMQERNWGIFTGRPFSEVKVILDPMGLDERYNYLPPQGESWKEFETRLIKAITTIIETDKTIVVVTHGGAIRALMPYLLNIPKEESFKYDPDNASLTIFEFNKGKFSKIIVNDTTHLNLSI